MILSYLVWTCAIIHLVHAYSTLFECETCLAAYPTLLQAVSAGLPTKEILRRAEDAVCRSQEPFTLDASSAPCIHFEHGICKLYNTDTTPAWSAFMANPFDITFDMTFSTPSLVTHTNDLRVKEQLQKRYIEIRHGYIAPVDLSDKAPLPNVLCRRHLSDLVKSSSFSIQMAHARKCQGSSEECASRFCRAMPLPSLSVSYCSQVDSKRKTTKPNGAKPSSVPTGNSAVATNVDPTSNNSPLNADNPSDNNSANTNGNNPNNPSEGANNPTEGAKTNSTMPESYKKYNLDVKKTRRGKCNKACARDLLRKGREMSRMLLEKRRNKAKKKGGLLKFLLGLWEALKSSSEFQNAMRKVNMKEALSQGTGMVRDSLRNLNP